MHQVNVEEREDGHVVGVLERVHVMEPNVHVHASRQLRQQCDDVRDALAHLRPRVALFPCRRDARAGLARSSAADALLCAATRCAALPTVARRQTVGTA